MPTFIQHSNVNIVTLYRDDGLAEHCRPGDVALKQEESGWTAYLIKENGQVERYGSEEESYDDAMQAAKKAADSLAH